MHWECVVLTTGLPGMSLFSLFLKCGKGGPSKKFSDVIMIQRIRRHERKSWKAGPYTRWGKWRKKLSTKTIVRNAILSYSTVFIEKKSPP